MRNTLSPASVPAICAIAALAFPLQAAAENTQQVNFVENVDGEVRVNISGKLRMLSQRIPAAACNAHAGISLEDSAAVLEAAEAEFIGILHALEHGDETYGVLSAEDRARTLRVIAKLQSAFDPLENAIASSSSRQALSDDTIQLLADQNMEVLKWAKLLVSEISGQYSNPVALLQSDAMAIDIAGRQRMLTQKMSKEVCLIMSGVNADASLEALAGTMNMFEVSLAALQNGMVDVGIQPPPNQDIIDGLAAVQDDWMAVRPHVQTVIDGGQIDNTARAELFAGLNKTLKDMNTVVGMYAEAAKLDL